MLRGSNFMKLHQAPGNPNWSVPNALGQLWIIGGAEGGRLRSQFSEMSWGPI